MLSAVSFVVQSILVVQYLLQLEVISMAIDLAPLPLPSSADPSYFVNFGREVKGVNLCELTLPQFSEIHDALYKVGSPVVSP